LVAPLATVLGNMINAGIQVIIFFGFLLFYIIRGDITPDYALLWLAPLLAALLLFNVLFFVALRQYVADVAMLMLEILANLFGLLLGF
jgi:ABC-type polysaccharide/polyol phosphate export permease